MVLKIRPQTESSGDVGSITTRIYPLLSIVLQIFFGHYFTFEICSVSRYGIMNHICHHQGPEQQSVRSAGIGKGTPSTSCGEWPINDMASWM